MKEELTERKIGSKWNSEKKKNMIQCNLVSLATETATKKVIKCQTRRMLFFPLECHGGCVSIYCMYLCYWERKRNEDGKLWERKTMLRTQYNHIVKIHISVGYVIVHFSRFLIVSGVCLKKREAGAKWNRKRMKFRKCFVFFIFELCAFCCCYLWRSSSWQHHFVMKFRFVEMITFVFYHVCIFLFLFAIDFVQHIGLFHLVFLAAFIHRRYFPVPCYLLLFYY